MSCARTFRLGLLLTALLAPMAVAEAAGPGAARVAVVPKSLGPAASNLHHRSVRTAAVRHAWVRAPGERHWRRSGRGLFTSAGYLGPWIDPAAGRSWHERGSDGDDRQQAIDHNSFESMPVRMGILRAPTPQPTIYRLEGRRDRPATRVIRISDPEPSQGRRSRFAHAETGALLLTVPGR
ncbi:hypothetical protein [Bosea sp. 124]|uniref:hypothetical protein n=1 Tax=Bosea sp. 124 TaxID=2135642 RepID=UPI000D3914C5|nr:hypothetical protein [Bosea sp. 124]PTM42512.1 hypothetical protein C8D03_4101 [Bosea sp. 124]